MFLSPEDHRLKDGRSVVLRSAVEDDAGPFLEVIRSYMLQNDGVLWEPDEYQKTEADISAWIGALHADECGLLLIAEREGQILGNIDFRVGDRRRIRHRGEFGMAVSPAHRGRGIGALLLGRLISWAAGVAQIERIELRAISTNAPAIGLYRKFGFKMEGLRPRHIKYADGSYADDLLMGLDLRDAAAAGSVTTASAPSCLHEGVCYQALIAHQASIMQIAIRELTTKDWEMFRQIRLRSLRDHPGVYLGSYNESAALTEDAWKATLDGQGKCIFGLFDGVSIIGLAAIFTSREDASGETGVLAMDYIDPAYRGRRLSNLLYEARIDWAKQYHPFKRLVISHREGNEASRRANQSSCFRYTRNELIDWPDGVKALHYIYELDLVSLRQAPAP